MKPSRIVLASAACIAISGLVGYRALKPARRPILLSAIDDRPILAVPAAMSLDEPPTPKEAAPPIPSEPGSSVPLPAAPDKPLAAPIDPDHVIPSPELLRGSAPPRASTSSPKDDDLLPPSADEVVPKADKGEPDPEKAAREFVEKNQKIAEKELASLRKEAAALRTRLQKVESAIRRWDAVASALRHSGGITSRSDGTWKANDPTAIDPFVPTELDPIQPKSRVDGSIDAADSLAPAPSRRSRRAQVNSSPSPAPSSEPAQELPSAPEN